MLTSPRTRAYVVPPLLRLSSNRVPPPRLLLLFSAAGAPSPGGARARRVGVVGAGDIMGLEADVPPNSTSASDFYMVSEPRRFEISSNGVLKLGKLTRQNHGMWSAQVLATLRGAKLERYVNGKAVAPAEEIDAKAADGTIVKAPNPAYEDWFAVDQQVLGFILMSLSRDILAQVAFSKTSAEAWKAIGDINVLLALATTKKDNMTVAQYYGKMKGLADEMAAAGKPLDDDDLQTQQEGAAAVVAASRCAAQTVVVVVGKTLAVALVDLVGVALVLGVAVDSNRCHDRTNNAKVSQLVQQQPTTTSAVQFVRFDENYVPEERHVAAAMSAGAEEAMLPTPPAAFGHQERTASPTRQQPASPSEQAPDLPVPELADVPPNSTSASDFYSPHTSSTRPSSAGDGGASLRAFHRSPPMLGFLCNIQNTYMTHLARFVPTTASSCSPHAGDHHGGWRADDARHGRVLLSRRMTKHLVLMVWDPITDHRQELPPIRPRPLYSYKAAIVCASIATCDHLGCHRGGPFLVVYIGVGYDGASFSCVYSSDAASWSEPVFVQLPLVNCINLVQSVLVGKTLYFTFHKNNQDGGLGFATTIEHKLYLWSRKDDKSH
nr:unnamed protein product [Digitaria exilis]